MKRRLVLVVSGIIVAVGLVIASVIILRKASVGTFVGPSTTALSPVSGPSAGASKLAAHVEAVEKEARADTTPNRLAAALERGEITREQFVLNSLRMEFEPAKVLKKYTGTAPVNRALLDVDPLQSLMQEARADAITYNAGTRTELDAMLERPADDPVESRPPSYDRPRKFESVPAADDLKKEDRFRIHFRDESSRSKAATMLAHFRTNFVPAIQGKFTLPRFDDGCTARRNPDKLIDVYLVSDAELPIEDGASIICRSGTYAGAYILIRESLDDSSRLATATHEATHLVQFEYSTSMLPTFGESIANFFAYRLVPPTVPYNDVPGNTVSEAKYAANVFNVLSQTELSLDQPQEPDELSSPLSYSRVLYLISYQDEKGPDAAVDLVRYLMQQGGSIASLKSYLGGDAPLAQQALTYSFMNAYTGQARSTVASGYYEGSEYPSSDPVQTWRSHDQFPASGSAGAERIGAAHVLVTGNAFLKTDGGTEDSMIVEVTDSGQGGMRYIVYRYDTPSSPTPIELQPTGEPNKFSAIIGLQGIDSLALAGVATGSTTGNFQFNYELSFPGQCPLPGTSGLAAPDNPACQTQCTDPTYVGQCYYLLDPGGFSDPYVVGQLGSFSATTQDCTQAQVDQQAAVVQCKNQSSSCQAARYQFDDGNLGPCQTSWTETICSSSTGCQQPTNGIYEIYQTSTQCDYDQTAWETSSNATGSCRREGNPYSWRDECRTNTWLGDVEVGLCGVKADPAQTTVAALPNLPYYGLTQSFCQAEVQRQYTDLGITCQSLGYPATCVLGWFGPMDTSSEPQCAL